MADGDVVLCLISSTKCGFISYKMKPSVPQKGVNVQVRIHREEKQRICWAKNANCQNEGKFQHRASWEIFSKNDFSPALSFSHSLSQEYYPWAATIISRPIYFQHLQSCRNLVSGNGSVVRGRQAWWIPFVLRGYDGSQCAGTAFKGPA